MKIQGKHYRSVWPIGEDAFGIIDQTKLPHEFVTIKLATLDDAAHAIKAMIVRGAPLIGAQFTVPPFPQNGTGGFIGATVNVGAAVSMRLIADPSDWDKTQHGITLGESGLPKSPHWSDQLADWRAVTPRAFPFTAAAVTKATKETLVLEPK